METNARVVEINDAEMIRILPREVMSRDEEEKEKR